MFFETFALCAELFFRALKRHVPDNGKRDRKGFGVVVQHAAVINGSKVALAVLKSQIAGWMRGPMIFIARDR